MRILQIEAWRAPEGWNWNQWYAIGNISREQFEKFYYKGEYGSIINAYRLFRWLRDEGYLYRDSVGKVAFEDDGYNIVVMRKGTREPFLAIEYEADL